jgi:two-component system CheB/CheR fusion protein
VGFSAGGLEALNELLSSLPPTLVNITFIIAQHLSPTYKSQLTHLLNRETALQVIEASNGSPIEAGKIYVTPPNVSR